jgi:hypothetical protein
MTAKPKTQTSLESQSSLLSHRSTHFPTDFKAERTEFKRRMKIRKTWGARHDTREPQEPWQIPNMRSSLRELLAFWPDFDVPPEAYSRFPRSTS